MQLCYPQIYEIAKTNEYNGPISSWILQTLVYHKPKLYLKHTQWSNQLEYLSSGFHVACISIEFMTIS